LGVLLLNRFVALAGTLAQTINVEYFNFAARVPDHPGFLKSARHCGYASALDTEHFSQELLCERKLIASRQIASAQQPAAKPGINFVMSHASCRLLRLRKQRLLMSHDLGDETFRLQRCALECSLVTHHRVALPIGLLHGSSRPCRLERMKYRRAISTHHGGLGHFPARKRHDERDDRAQWKENCVDGVASLIQPLSFAADEWP
jgi:hypothetical protein